MARAPRVSLLLALALAAAAQVRAQDPPDAAAGFVGVLTGKAGVAPRLVLDLDRKPYEGRGFWGTVFRGRPRAAEHNFFDLPFPLDARRTAAGGPDLEGLPISRVTTFFRLPREKAFIKKAFELAEEECSGFSP